MPVMTGTYSADLWDGDTSLAPARRSPRLHLADHFAVHESASGPKRTLSHVAIRSTSHLWSRLSMSSPRNVDWVPAFCLLWMSRDQEGQCSRRSRDAYGRFIDS